MRTLIIALALALTVSIAEAEAPGRSKWEPVPPPRSAAPAGAWEERDVTDIVLFTATAYSPECGTGDGLTASMTPVRPGVVAVDPEVIPLGSQVEIVGLGVFSAEDVGGQIKGNRVDIFMSSRGDCIRWGVREVEVRVLEWSSDRNPTR